VKLIFNILRHIYEKMSVFTKDLLYVKEQKRLFLCPKTFIVKIRIILFSCTSMIYSQTERRGNRLVARETERECVCDLALPENVVGVRCKTAACKRVDFVVMRTCTLKLFV
jgi:hypothetical protein